MAPPTNLSAPATGTLIGKQAYIAPEQLRGKAVPQSDFYALAGTLFYLLTAKDPIPLSISRPSQTGITIDPIFDDLIARLSSFEVDERQLSAGDIASTLDGVHPAADANAAVVS